MARGNAAPAPLVVVTPTRGLVHSRTVEAVLCAVEVAEQSGQVQRVPGHWWHWAHGLPIPQSHEQATEAALETGAEYLWFIEDDNVPPADALGQSLKVMDATGAGMVPVTYPIGTRGTRWDSVYRENGEILFCGLGITLVKAEVFSRLAKPWFSLANWYGRVPDGKGGTKLGLLDRPYPENVGGVDVVFGIRVREQAGYRIEQVPGMVGGHLRITQMGAGSGSGVNKKPHVVEEWNTIDMDQRIFVAEDRSRFYDHSWGPTFRSMGPWETGFWLADQFFGGRYDAVHDKRVQLARERFPQARTVLELGALEGGHTVALSRWAQKVTAVEGRERNLEKARWILQVHQVQNANIVLGNLETMDLTRLKRGRFDLIFNVGVLYHMPDPVSLLDQCAKAGKDMFLWTHYSADRPRMYLEAGLKDPLSGLSKESLWMTRPDLLEALERRWRTVQVLGEERAHPAGAAITIACEGAR